MIIDSKVDQIFRTSFIRNRMEETLICTKIIIKNIINTLNSTSKTIIKFLHFSKNNKVCTLI